MLKTMILALLCVSALSQSAKVRADFDRLQAKKMQIASSAVGMTDCWEKAHLPIKPGSLLLQHENVPGAGIVKFKPFEMVLKDGFLKVDCVKDYMYYGGDKFGDNRHNYKLGSTSNVSVVHYDAHVAKEDRKEMTPKLCFEFCRTVPNMGFFGIVNGRNCYCTPYFTPMESDSSQCDAICEGDHTNMCGGASKSSVFAMHMCDSTKGDLGARINEATSMVAFVKKRVGKAREQSVAMQRMGAELQKSLGEVGDSGATELLQSAKQFAGELEHKADEAEEQGKALAELASQESDLRDFTLPSTVSQAERIMEGIDKTLEQGNAVANELITLEAYAQGQHEPRPSEFEHSKEAPPHRTSSLSGETEVVKLHENSLISSPCMPVGYFPTIEGCVDEVISHPECQDGFFDYTPEWQGPCWCATSLDIIPYNGAPWMFETIYQIVDKKVKKEEHPSPLLQYFPVMYFVDKKFEKVPTTCSGDLVAKPIIGKDQTTALCAAACNAHIHDCTGFQFFKDGADTLCFLFSKFNTGFYYAGCGEASGDEGSSAPLSFLQTRSSSPSFAASCYAKVSKFEGTSLAPKANGKCKQCFKKLTKADRCY